MSSIYVDCAMGAAGDMLCAALYELLGEEQKASFLERFNALFSKYNVTLAVQKTQRCGIMGTRFCVAVNGEQEGEVHEQHDERHNEQDSACKQSCLPTAEHDEGHIHEHEHTRDPRHKHHHTSMACIEGIVCGLDVSGWASKNIIEVYRLIAAAESEAHGVDVEEVHFHEVGAMDAVADVTSFTLLLEALGRPHLMSSSINVGSGFVHCAHGVLPVPAPATAILLRGVPFYTSSIEAELCTPTGAALLRHFAQVIGAHKTITASKIGYGMGSRELKQCNCVRAYLCDESVKCNQEYVRAQGDASDMDECSDGGAADTDGNASKQESSGAKHIEEDTLPQGMTDVFGTDEVAILECEIDDMTGEEVGFAIERIMEEGALDAHTAPVFMKKGRPGVSLTCICSPCDMQKTAALIFRLTTTLGLRARTARRYRLDRVINEKDSVYGKVRVKTVTGGIITRTKVEADDAARIAREKGVSLREAKEVIEKGV